MSSVVPIRFMGISSVNRAFTTSAPSLPAANTFCRPRRVDVAGADRVDVDAERRDLERQRLGIADDRRPASRPKVENPGIGWIAEIAVMLRMLPPPRACIARHDRAGHPHDVHQVLLDRLAPRRIVEAQRESPAAARHRCSPGCRCRRARAAPFRRHASQSSARRQSAWIGRTCAPVSLRSRAADACRSASRRAVIATVARSCASARAMP